MKDFQCSQLLVSKQDHPSRGADFLHCCFQSLVNNLSMCASVSHLYTQTGNISLSKDTDMLKEGFVCMTACCIQWNIFCQWELPLTVSTIFWAQIRSCLWKKPTISGQFLDAQYFVFCHSHAVLLFSYYCVIYNHLYLLFTFFKCLRYAFFVVVLRLGLWKKWGHFALICRPLGYIAIIS